jgi:hypothetical protein
VNTYILLVHANKGNSLVVKIMMKIMALSAWKLHVESNSLMVIACALTYIHVYKHTHRNDTARMEKGSHIYMYTNTHTGMIQPAWKKDIEAINSSTPAQPTQTQSSATTETKQSADSDSTGQTAEGDGAAVPRKRKSRWDTMST